MNEIYTDLESPNQRLPLVDSSLTIINKNLLEGVYAELCADMIRIIDEIDLPDEIKISLKTKILHNQIKLMTSIGLSLRS